MDGAAEEVNSHISAGGGEACYVFVTHSCKSLNSKGVVNKLQGYRGSHLVLVSERALVLSKLYSELLNRHIAGKEIQNFRGACKIYLELIVYLSVISFV